MEEEEHEMCSLRARRKKSSVGISCCFSGTTQHRRRASFDSAPSNSSHSPIPHPSPRLISSPSAWIKSKTNDLPEIKGKCRNFISRMARHRRHASADFSYDPLSYALNFDDDAASSSDQDFQAMNNFTARLPVSPPRTRMTSTKTTTPSDHDHLPRTVLIPRSRPDVHYKEEDQFATPDTAVGPSDELRRGFEALSLSMKRRSRSVEEAPVDIKVAGDRRNKIGEVSSPSPREAGQVRRSKVEAEDVDSSPVGISSNRGILVELC
ncbi:hypothetical protein CDL12_04138 [Handroanthus impetiginosus]|uniref:Uncharacterized protein n=1 Tax=Handroanthus impetiginosus TaxID=429701 RepID=A0A2G9I047_9LAMI|nr:hypothetical protein CDL12_04138 [Handroanthus impetiginosus]